MHVYINVHKFGKTLKLQTNHKCTNYVKPKSLVQSSYVLDVFVAVYKKTIKIITNLCVFRCFSPCVLKIWESFFQDVGYL